MPVSRHTGPFYPVLRHRAEDLTGGGKKIGKAAPGRREPRRLRLRGGTSPGPFWAGRGLGYGLFGTFALASGRVPASQDELQSKPQALWFPIRGFVFIVFIEFAVFTHVLREIWERITGNLCRFARPGEGILPNRGWTLRSARQSGKPIRQFRSFIAHCFRYSTSLAPVNAPASWPLMNRTAPHAGFPFSRRKTKHRSFAQEY